MPFARPEQGLIARGRVLAPAFIRCRVKGAVCKSEMDRYQQPIDPVGPEWAVVERTFSLADQPSD